MLLILLKQNIEKFHSAQLLTEPVVETSKGSYAGEKVLQLKK